MRIICIGDVAISDENLTAWLPPGGITLDDKTRILFNWELPIGTKINPVPRSSGPRLLSHENSIYVIRNWAPGFAALATNHILDAGEEGLASTISALNQAGFQTVGAGKRDDDIKRPIIWETDEGRLAIINWVFPETHPEWEVIPGPNCWPGVEAAEWSILNLKELADWVMVFVHWSDEDFSYPRPEDREIARQLIKMGADVIIGNHPHVVRGMEVIDNCAIFYSLGNFYFSNYQNASGKYIVRQAPRNRESLGVELVFQRRLKPIYHLHSFWQVNKACNPDPFRRAARTVERVSKPLIRHTGSSYASWYAKHRASFDIWGYRFYFRTWQLGISGMFRYIAKTIAAIK
jgi:hypothetical protein